VQQAAVVLAVLVFGAALYFIFKKSILNYSELKEHGYVGVEDMSTLVGKEGVTQSSLRPTGSVMFDGKRVHVVTEGSFIEADALVRVTEVKGNRVVVEKVQLP
jgi:membrane-bound ClpP family serine protease